MAKSEREKLKEKYAPISREQHKTFQKNLPVFSFGIPDIDIATGAIDPVNGNGGIRARDTALIVGRNGSCKTAIANSFIRTTQQRWPDHDIVCIFSEPQTIDRLEEEGVDVDKLIILYQYHPDMPANLRTAEAALEGMLDFCKLESTIACVIDSVAMLEPEGEQSKDMGDASQVAGLAKHYNRFITRYVQYTHTAPLIQLNHWSPPVDTKPKFGGKKNSDNDLSIHSVGGFKKDFLAKLGIFVEQAPDYTDSTKHSQSGKMITDVVKINAKLYRNKYAPAMRQVELKFDSKIMRFNCAEQVLAKATYFCYADGKDKAGKVIWKSKLNPGILQAGAYFTIAGEKIQGKDNAIKYLEDNPEIMHSILCQIAPKGKEFFLDKKPKGGEQDEDSLDK